MYVYLSILLQLCVSTLVDGEQQFLDLEEKLNRLAKYAPHLWKDDVRTVETNC